MEKREHKRNGIKIKDDGREKRERKKMMGDKSNQYALCVCVKLSKNKYN